MIPLRASLRNKDRSERAADEIVDRYVKPGILGIGASHSGNHTQVYGEEESCAAARTARSGSGTAGASPWTP